jgi:hypothetical protein
MKNGSCWKIQMPNIQIQKTGAEGGFYAQISPASDLER